MIWEISPSLLSFRFRFENKGTSVATVSDLNIEIKGHTFTTSVYDKTDVFNFEVVKCSSLQSNLPDTILYNVFYSQALCFLTICSSKSSFMDSMVRLFIKCKNKVATNQKLLR